MESHEMLREVFSMSCTCFTGCESLNKPHHIAMMQASFEELQIAATNMSILHVDAEVEEKSSSPDARP